MNGETEAAKSLPARDAFTVLASGISINILTALSGFPARPGRHPWCANRHCREAPPDREGAFQAFWLGSYGEQAVRFWQRHFSGIPLP